MDLEFPDIDIDHLLDTTTALEDGFLAPYKQIPMPKINGRVKERRIRLAERIAQGDDLIRQVKQLQAQNKKLADLQRTAQEVTDLYQKEKQQRLELQKKSQQLGDRCAELEKELDAQVIIGENLQEELEKRALPVDAKEVLGILLQLEQRLGDDAGLVRRDQNIVKKLKDYCKTANISMPTPKSPSPRNKRRSQATQTDAGPVPEKPILCSVAVQVENLIQTRDQSMQFKATTTTRGTTTASFIKKCHVGTTFPEPKPMPNVQQILDEMLSWRDEPLGPLSPLCDFPLEVEEQHMPATVSVATSTTLCNIHREIDFISEVPPQIKVSASRPPSRTMLDSVKEEARSSRELAKELLNFLPQNQSCLANLPPQAFEELWQVFGQMVLGLLQRRPSPPTVSQADFTRWLYELYEGTQCQPEENSSNSASKKDFSASTECMDVGLDPIIASPNISHGGDITPIRLPPKPKERKRKSKKRQAAASLIKPIAKRTCQEMKPAEDHPGNTQESVKLVEEQEPETAIQFLSNLNTFNMANCDNLDNMELDEEEMYLLQLTSKVTRQAEQEQATEGECVSHFPTLPKVLADTESSLKDDMELEHFNGITCKETDGKPDENLEHTANTENLEDSGGITCQETEGKPEENLPTLPDLFTEETDLPLSTCPKLKNKQKDKTIITSLPDLSTEVLNPSEPVLGSADFDMENQPKGKANTTNFLKEPPSSLDTSFNGSDSQKESNLCEKQLPSEETDSDLNSEKVFSDQEHPAFITEAIPEVDKNVYSSDSDSEDYTMQSVTGSLLDSNSCKSNKSKGRTLVDSKRSISYLFGSDSESEASEEQLPKEDTESEEDVSESESEIAETKTSFMDSEEEFNRSDSDSSEQKLPKEDTELDAAESEEDLSLSESEASEQELLEEVTKWSPIASKDEFYDKVSESESCKKLLPKQETKWRPIESEEEASKQQLPKEDTESDPIESEEDVSQGKSESSKQKLLKEASSEYKSESCKKLLSKEETKLPPEESEKELLDMEASSESFKEPLAKEHNSANIKTFNETDDKPEYKENKLNKKQTLKTNITDLPLVVAENHADQTELIPSLNRDSNSDLQKKEKLLSTQISSPALSSNDDSGDEDKLVIDAELPPSITSKDSPSTVTSKRKRTLSEIKSPPTPGEGRLTRQRAKQMLLEEKSQTENRISLVEQIRRQLQQALDKSEPLRRDPAPAKAVKQFQQTLSKLEPLKTDPAPAKSVEKFQPAVNKSEPPKGIYSPDPAKSKKNPDEPEQSFGSYEESPASPCAEPLDDNVDSIPEIPLEQPNGLQYGGQPKSIIEHVIDEYKAQPKLSQLRRKTLGKSQQKLCSSIGKYLEESLDLEDFSLEVYKLTKDEAVIVNALVVVITKMGIEGNPLQRLISALNYFKFMPRFLAELEERLFRNTKERPPTELAMKYVKLYLEAVSNTARVTQEYTNPARLLLAKLLYHYEQDMPETVLAVLRQFPTALPHREERQYDHSDPLITVIKHLLMSRTYDMQDPDGAERLLLSKLRFEYHYQPFEPSKQQVLENLVEKLKAGRSLEQLGYAFALFCRRSPHLKVVDLVTEHLMPLATSYCDLAQDESYDDRLVAVLQCISMVLKPLPLDTDISALVGLVKRLIVAVPRPGVQQAAVQACLRLQRFGFQTIRDALQNYRPKYPLDPLTRAMLRCFAERRKQYHILATKGICARK
ncbi:little elongation complex subunit 1 [Drosophila kikkawai]|uniref:Little elongation complex subunit 1 n=1 Tax=Drosophila kikkawai TaxID=30033 RepID=A0A6P4IGE1_DROKI|nr:little elongation complex subunit 1 [Drosophila kikkawai]